MASSAPELLGSDPVCTADAARARESEPSVSQHCRSLDDAAASNNAKPGPAEHKTSHAQSGKDTGREVQELLAENGRRLLRESKMQIDGCSMASLHITGGVFALPRRAFADVEHNVAHLSRWRRAYAQAVPWFVLGNGYEAGVADALWRSNCSRLSF